MEEVVQRALQLSAHMFLTAVITQDDDPFVRSWIHSLIQGYGSIETKSTASVIRRLLYDGMYLTGYYRDIYHLDGNRFVADVEQWISFGEPKDKRYVEHKDVFLRFIRTVMDELQFVVSRTPCGALS